jgi:L-arabinose isomerase
MHKPLHIGLFAIGLEAYWPQFKGLEDRLLNNLKLVAKQLEFQQTVIVNAGMVDNVDKAFVAGDLFQSNSVELIFVYVSTYALSATVLPAVQRCKVPVIILNVVPENAIDYTSFNSLQNRTAMTGEWLAYCNACPVPEMANVFNRCGIKYFEIIGTLNENDNCWLEAKQWIEAAKVKHTISYNRLGLMGHYYSGMLDIYTDLTLQYKYFGGHIEHLEVEQLVTLIKNVTQKAIDDKLALFKESFDIQNDCSKEDLTTAATTAVALEQLVAQYQLGSLAYYYKGTGNADNENAIASIILGNSLLTANHVPVAGEYEVKNVQAMKIMDSFGAGGSFTEYYGIDLNEDIVLMGHDGPGHIAIAANKTKVKPLQVYHGKVGKGLSVEMQVQHGKVTLLSVVETAQATLILLCAEAASVEGPILEIGNTNSRYKFKIGAKNFMQQWNSYGPAHHCAVGVGHIADKIKKLGALLNMEVVQVG